MARQKSGGKGKGSESERLIRDERYRALFESSSDAIMLLDRERFFDCNPATLRMFGLTGEEFIKLHPSEISPPRQANGRDSKSEADRRISEAFERGVNKFEWIHRRSNGEDFPATVWLTAFPLEGREVLQATVREIELSHEEKQDLESHRLKLQMLLDERGEDFRKESEERKSAEAEVKRLIKAVETSFNAIALFDMDMNFIYANRRFCEMLGIEARDIKERNAGDFVPQNYLKVISTNIEKSKEGAESETFEVMARNAQGRDIWVEISGSVLFGDGGEPEGLLAIINDVTERREMLEALKESEEKFKMLVERSLDGIVIIQDGKVVYMNPVMVTLSGYALEEQIGRDFIQNIAPEMRDVVMDRYTARVKGKNVPPIYEIALFAKDGSRIPIEVNACVMEYGGAPADFVYVRDLTERKKSEEEVRRVKEQFEYVLGATNTGFDIIDEDLNVVYVDPKWAEALGDYSGRKCHEYFMGAKKPCDTCAIPEALNNGKRTISEEFLKKENRHIEVHTIPLKADGGKRLVAEFNIDITERKEMLRELSESEEKFRNLAEHSPNMIFINRQGRVIYANRMCEEVMGYTKEEFSSPDFDLTAIIHEDYHELIRSNLKRHFTGEDLPQYEYKLVTKNGNILDAVINTKTIEYGGGTAILGIVTDITRLKRAEEALRSAEELLRSVMDTIPARVFWKNRELRYLGSNLPFAKDAGFSNPKELLGKDDLQMGWREQAEMYRADDRAVMESGVPKIGYEEPQTLPDGKTAWVRTSKVPLRDADGNVFGVLGTYEDITERKMAEQKLAENETRYRELAEGISSGLAVYRAVDNGKDFEFVDLNRAAEKMENVKRAMVIGKKVSEVFPGIRKMGLLGVFKRVWKSGKPERLPVSLYKDERLHSWRDNYVYRLPSGEVVAIYDDVTEKKLTEETLRESEVRYRTLMEKANDAIFLADAKTGIVIEVNQKACELVGRGRDELIGMHQSKLHPQGEMKRYEKIFRSHVKKGTATEENIHVAHKDEHTIPVSISASVLEIQGKRVYQGIFHDLSERARAEEELRSSREQLNAIFQASMDGVGVEKDGILTIVNQSFAKLFGYSGPEDMIGMPLAGIISPVDKKRVASYARLRLRGKAPSRYEYVGLRKDGSTFNAEASISVYELKGKHYYVGFVQDITERKRSEAILQESEARFRRMAENIHDGLTIIENGKVSYINERACEIYGYPREELMKMTHLDLIIAEDREQMRTLFENARKSGQRLGELEFWLQRKDGTRRYVRTRTSTSQEGESINEFIITTDITARKLAEDENKRRVMKFLLEDGRIYLVKEFRPEMSVEAFNDLLNLDYFGLVMSRTPKKDLARTIAGAFEYLWLGEKSETCLFDEMIAAISGTGGKSAVLIDRLDYLVFKYGFKETLDFIFRLRDITYLKEQIVIISIDPTTMKEEELNVMQKEMNEVEHRQAPRPPEELYEIAQFIYEKNSSGIKPSYSDIGEALKLSKPTFRKRARRLIKAGYAVELTKGNKKVLELTQRGRSLFFK